MTLADAGDGDEVYVPNCTVDEAVQIWLWLSGLREDFPSYKEGSNLVIGVEEEAWCAPKVYREAYCPPTMTCIVRQET